MTTTAFYPISRCAPRALCLVSLPALLAASAALAQTPPPAAAPALADSVRPAAQPQAARLTDELLRPFRFRLIGPANQSGRVTAIAPAGRGGKTVYVAFASGGVWKTTNRGTTWSPLFDDAGLASIGDVAVAPSDANVVWVGTGERNSLRSNGWGDGVYKSTNGGRAWKQMGLEDARQIGRIAIHPKDPNIVYVAALGHLWGANAERGVYKTTDGGSTWQKVLFVNDTTGFVDLKMDPSNPDVLYAAGWHRFRWGGGRMEGAGAGSGIWKTTDGGRSWKKLSDPALNNGLATRNLGRVGLAVHPKNPKLVYAIIQAAHGSTNPALSPFGGLFRSADAGATWTRVNDLSAVPDYYYNEVWLDPNDEQKLFLAGTQLAHSKDGGKTVASFDLGRVHVDHHALWIDPEDSDHMILGNDGGIYVSYDAGENWQHHPMPTGQFYEVDIDTTKFPYHVCGGLQDNGVWCGPSRTRERVGITNFDWYTVYGGDGFRSAVSPDSPNIRYAESQFGNLSRTHVDEARNYPLQPHSEDAGAESGYEFRWDWDAPFIISQHDPKTLYFGGNYLFKLKDRGRDWEILGPEMTRQNRAGPEPDVGYTTYYSLHSIAESPLDARVLWTGSNDGLLWVSTDGGKSWSNVTENVPDAAARRCVVAEIEASRFDKMTAYVAYDCHNRDDYLPYVYKTADGGRSFANLSGDLPRDGGSYVVREDAVNPKLLFVGTERGVWVSNEGGGRWLRLKSGLPTVAVRDLDIVLRDRELVVGTFGRSVYVLDIAPLQELTETVVAQESHLFPVKPARSYRARSTYASFGDQFFTADNPPSGAVITYYLQKDLARDVTLTITKAPPAAPAVAMKASGNGGVNAPSSQAGDRQEEVQTLTGSGRPGIHQVVWDLRSRRPRPRELGGPLSQEELREVLPGTYRVTLRVGEQTHTQDIVVESGWLERMPGRVR